MSEKKTLPLKNLPDDVDELIRKEQLRLELFDGKALKKPEVVFHMLREWLKLKNEKALIQVNG
ncbi:MAG TPA: hypothetical protein PL045_06230 [Chitinophagaceae bacterium]|nr:hypothetical protein [Chitinophagaceae bacterium]